MYVHCVEMLMNSSWLCSVFIVIILIKPSMSGLHYLISLWPVIVISEHQTASNLKHKSLKQKMHSAIILLFICFYLNKLSWHRLEWLDFTCERTRCSKGSVHDMQWWKACSVREVDAGLYRPHLLNHPWEINKAEREERASARKTLRHELLKNRFLYSQVSGYPM